jgi:hypothetical protein
MQGYIAMKQLCHALLLITVLVSARCQTRDAVEYVGIPAGSDFPASERRLLGDVAHGKTADMRWHAWRVFAGLTRTTTQKLPVWQTWYSVQEVFAHSFRPGPHRVDRIFVNPRQFDVLETNLDHGAGRALLSFILFNQEAAEHIHNRGLYQQATLNALNSQFDNSMIPIRKRNIEKFGLRSVALKTVWWLVKKDTVTPMPVWDGTPPTGDQFLPRDWTRCVGIDPSRMHVPRKERRSLNCNGRTRNSRVVSLSRFYYFPIDVEQLASVRGSSIQNADQAELGDFVVLVAMHLTTKEIPNWVWASFWWHDSPGQGEFAANRPVQVRGVWRNFLMTTSYSMTRPLASDGKAHIAFNPWLEARFKGGVRSNCMNCHRQAAWLEPGGAAGYSLERSQIGSGDERFRTAVKLDFIWSIAEESIEKNNTAGAAAPPH